MNLGRMGRLARLGATAPSNAQLTSQIDAIFQKYFGRQPAAAGLQFWDNAVTTGQVTDENLPLAIVQSAQAADKAFFITNYPQLAEQVYGVQTPSTGTTPTTAPVVTSTAPQSAAATAAQQAAAQSGGMGTNTMLMLGAVAVGAWYLLEHR